jgi:hypothetical protein
MSLNNGINISNSAITSLPGASNSAVILWDSTADPGLGITLARRRASPNLSRATVRIYADQVVTLFAEDLARGSTTWRAYNNGGAGDATTINTWFEKNILFPGDDHRLRVVTVTAPTVWEVSVKLWPDPGLAQ